MSTALYLSDLITGLFASLAVQAGPERSARRLSIRGNKFDRALSMLVSQDLPSEAAKSGLAVRFRVQPHSLHGDSAVVQRALYEAAQREIISFDNPEFQNMSLKLTAREAERYFDALPGPRDMYARLTQRLLDYYDANE